MKRALLVIDMVNDFVRPDGALSCGKPAQDIIAPISKLISSGRDRGDDVLFLCDRHRSDDPEFDLFAQHCVAGTEGASIISELDVRRDDIVVPKRRFSAFVGTDLDLLLRENGVEAIDLVGVCTNICVLYTACDAVMRGYKVRVFTDAVASFDDDAHSFALKEMDQTLGVELAQVWEAQDGQDTVG